ncbi:MAG: hypothetical protein ACRDXE_06445, partial [Acidimicrobiales bacterium]
ARDRAYAAARGISWPGITWRPDIAAAAADAQGAAPAAHPPLSPTGHSTNGPTGHPTRQEQRP